MKRIRLFTGILFLLLLTAHLMTSCTGCSRKKANDVTSLPGVYKGQASIELPEHIKSMIKPAPDGKKLIPDEPVPCKLEITRNPQEEIFVQLIDFQMPVEGIKIEPAKCKITQTADTFYLTGSGNVTYGKQTISYSPNGTIKEDEMDLKITVSIIPMILEVQILFKGKK